MSSTSINRKLIEQSISKNAKKIIAASGMNPSTRSGSKELDHAVKRLAQQPFASLTAAIQVGEELGRRIVELSQQMGKQNLDGGVIRQLILKQQLPSVDASLVDSRPVVSSPLIEVEEDGEDVSDLQVSEIEDESAADQVENGLDLEEPKEGHNLTAKQASKAVEPEEDELEEDELEANIAVEVVDEVDVELDDEIDDAVEEIFEELDNDLAALLVETELVDSDSGSLEADLADEEVAEEMAVAEDSDDAEELAERSIEAEADTTVAETDEAELEADMDAVEIDAVEIDTAAVDETEIDAVADAAVAETDEAAVIQAEAALDDTDKDVEAEVTIEELDDVAEEPLTEAVVAEPESQEPQTKPETKPAKATK